MPSCISHWLFAKEALEKNIVPEDLSAFSELIVLGSQGSDPFFFSGRIPKLCPKHREQSLALRSFASRCHGEEPDFWLGTCLRALKGHPEELPYTALIYGFFLHYILDARFHPYVFSKSGFDTKGELTPPWNARHSLFEGILDSALLKAKGKIFTSSIAKELRRTSKKTLYKVSASLANTFPQDLSTKSYAKSVIEMARVYRILYDPRGIKRKVLGPLAGRNTFVHGYIAPVFASEAEEACTLGSDGKAWLDPVSGKERQESALDLYKLALEDAKQLASSWQEMLKNKVFSPALEKRLEKRNHDGLKAREQRNTMSSTPFTQISI